MQSATDHVVTQVQFRSDGELRNYISHTLQVQISQRWQPPVFSSMAMI